MTSCFHSLYLPKVPCASTYLFFCAVVNPPSVVQDVLLPLFLIIQEHCVLWENMVKLSPAAAKFLRLTLEH